MYTGQIPFDWFKASQYFITYWGEIFFGKVFLLQGYDDRFFIIQNDKIKEISDGPQTLERYQQLGREIKDFNVIKDVRADLGQEYPWSNLNHKGNYKKMFVFGAAASTYCVFGEKAAQFRNAELNPPTGYEIFDEKYSKFIEKYLGAKLSIPSFESMGKDIEQCMEREWDAYKGNYMPEITTRHTNIQFYLQSLFRAISEEVVTNHYRANLYSLFVTKIQNYIRANTESRDPDASEKISLVSFNYDTILDNFISEMFQWRYETTDHYVNLKNRILLFKPHGSCNWGWKIDMTKIPAGERNNISNYIYTSKLEPWQIYFNLLSDLNSVSKNSWGIEHSNDKNSRGRFTINKDLIHVIPKSSQELYFPALLLPYRDKDEMIMPYFHWEVLHSIAIPEIEELYLIGWKGSEELFNRKLQQANRLKKIIIVNPDSETVKTNLDKHIDLAKYTIEVINSFEDFVLNHLDNYLLQD